MTNTIRWSLATVSAVALALLTLNADPFSSTPIEAFNAGGGCPAAAKPANFNFTLNDISNKPVKLSAFKGKVILMDFWATWCGPCKIEIPWFMEFQEKYGKNGLQVLGVSVDDTLAKLKPYVTAKKMNYVILQALDHDDMQDAYGPMLGIPTTLLISRDGNVCSRHTGLTGKDIFEREIKALLGVS